MARTVGKARSSKPVPARSSPTRARAAPRAVAPKPAAKRTGIVRKTRSVLSDAPGIMVSLNAEHRHIASLLDALARQSDGLLPGRDADITMVRDIVKYLNDFPDEYHHPREDLLFQILSQRDPGSHEVIRQLQDGHREIYRRSRELLDLVADAETADDDGRRRQLKYPCDRYIGFYRDHINLEEGVVFRRATEKLRREDWAAVNAGSRQVDDPLFGQRVRKEYRRLSQYLGTRAERVGEEIALAEVFGLEAAVEGTVSALVAAAEIRGIVGRHLRATFGECIAIAGRGSSSAGFDAVLQLPQALAGSVRSHSTAGRQEVGVVIARARSELAESVAVRFRYLRTLLG